MIKALNWYVIRYHSEDSPPTFPITHYQINNHFPNKDLTDINFRNLYTNRIPDLCVLLIRSQAHSKGSTQHNLLNFLYLNDNFELQVYSNHENSAQAKSCKDRATVLNGLYNILKCIQINLQLINL